MGLKEGDADGSKTNIGKILGKKDEHQKFLKAFREKNVGPMRKFLCTKNVHNNWDFKYQKKNKIKNHILMHN